MKKIKIRVKPNAKQQSIEMAEDGSLIVRLQSPPVDGKANKELIELLAKYYQLRRSQIEITSGTTSRDKWITLHDNP